MTVHVNECCAQAKEQAAKSGFHEYIPSFGIGERDARHILAWLMLITTEVAEAAEEVRKGTSLAAFAEELADVCIRTFDTAGMLNIDLDHAIQKKMLKNSQRPIPRHGKLV